MMTAADRANARAILGRRLDLIAEQLAHLQRELDERPIVELRWDAPDLGELTAAVVEAVIVLPPVTPRWGR